MTKQKNIWFQKVRGELFAVFLAGVVAVYSIHPVLGGNAVSFV
ncbi:MAG: hypothetical protein U0520_01940 [Candidatus Saccharimonadales bacterium]